MLFRSESMKILIIGYILLLTAILDTVLLAFGYRDFSWELLGMTLLTVLGLPLAFCLITKQDLLLWFISEDENDNRLQVCVEELEDNELSRGFFESCR